MVLWEIWSDAAFPYAFIGSDEAVGRRVSDGDRLERPKDTPDGVWGVMSSCWAAKAKDRPDMSALRDQLQAVEAKLRSSAGANATLLHMESFGSNLSVETEEGEEGGGSEVKWLRAFDETYQRHYFFNNDTGAKD